MLKNDLAPSNTKVPTSIEIAEILVLALPAAAIAPLIESQSFWGKLGVFCCCAPANSLFTPSITQAAEVTEAMITAPVVIVNDIFPEIYNADLHTAHLPDSESFSVSTAGDAWYE